LREDSQCNDNAIGIHNCTKRAVASG
jgi:hypothetical protein